jgi:hypothetical protein
MLLGLTVTWGGRRMMSTFEIEVPLPPTKLSIVWSIPPLVRLQQATLSFGAVNVTDDPIDAIVEIQGSPMIPLLKHTFFINTDENLLNSDVVFYHFGFKISPSVLITCREGASHHLRIRDETR